MNHLLQQQLIDVAYIVAVTLFVLALKWLSSPATAKHGVLAGEFGAVLAVTATLCDYQIIEYKWIIVALAVGAIVGIPLGPGVHDRRAPADRSKPRFWRAGGGDDRHCRVLRAHSPPHEI
jgi:NAD/NADP transhydrogenase beta subunit